MTRRLIALCSAVLLIPTACGGDGDSASDGTAAPPVETATTATSATTEPVTTDAAPPSTEAAPETTEAAPETTEAAAPTTEASPSDPVGVGLPAECLPLPVTITAQRVGTAPIGSDAFEVVDSVVVPLPIVPNPDGALGADEIKSLSATTDLLGYSLVFADEEIQGGGSMFFQYEPTTAGKLRGLVSIFPAAAGVPLAAGDVVTYGEASGLSIPLPTIGVDFAEFEQENTNTYLNDPTGQVGILGITDDAVCLDVDLTWAVDDPEDNTLTIRGVITGRLLERSTLYTLG